MDVFYVYNLTSKSTISINSVLSTEITYFPTEIQFQKNIFLTVKKSPLEGNR